jgi:hypothetical protein
MDGAVDELRGHLITTGADGVLQTPAEEVDAMIEAMCAAPRAVLHFHGGLVSEETGLKAAHGLLRGAPHPRRHAVRRADRAHEHLA